MNSTIPPALAPQWLKKNLPRFLRREDESPVAIERLEILNSWESHERTTILYQLELRDTAGTKRQQIYVGYLVADERLAKEYKSAGKKAEIEPAIGRAVALIPEANLVLLACPNDRKLASLSEESLRAWLESSLHRIAGRALSRRQWHMQEMTIETLRHVPDKRRTTRCRVRMRADNGLRGEIAFIAKQLNDSKKARALFRNLRALATAWPNPDCDTKAGRTGLGKIRPPIRLPQALGLYDEKAVVFVEELEGKNMLEALPELDLAQVMPAVGELLAQFHRAQRRVRKSVSRRSELTEVRGAAQTIGTTLPHLPSRLDRLYEALQSVGWQDRAPSTLLHGSFRLNHILFNAGELALLDLDSLRMGRPEYDLANFLSALYYFEEQQRLSSSQRLSTARYFLEGYAANAQHEITPVTVLWFLASLLINKQASKYVCHYHRDRKRKVERMIALAEQVVATIPRLPADLKLAALWRVLP